MIANKIVGLNLGSRNRAIPGYLNMDIDQHEGVDIVGDISDLSSFENCSVENIYASHVLEHFPHTQTLAVLKEWNRVLVPGGVLYVAVPDFRRAVELYIKCGLNDWTINYLWGDQGYKTAFHYRGFDEMSLRDILKQSGFSEISRVANFPIGDIHDCSHLVSSFDNQSVSLNMVAVK